MSFDAMNKNNNSLARDSNHNANKVILKLILHESLI